MSWLSDLVGVQPKRFRYTLVTPDNSYVLPNAPIGWEENIIRWQRSETYFGMIRTFSVPLEFVLDGAWILRTGFYTLGLRNVTTLKIEQLIPSTWGYELLFQGEIDFSTFSDELTTVTVTVMEGGITANIKAYENVKYSIPINVPDAIDVLLTPLKLQEKSGFIFTPTIDRRVEFIPGLELITNEVQALGEPSSYAVEMTIPGLIFPPVIVNSDIEGKFFYKAKIDNTIKVAGNIKGSVKAGTGTAIYAISVYRYRADAFVDTFDIFSQSIPATTTVPIDQDFDIDIPVLEGDILYIFTAIGLGGGTLTDAGFIFTEGELNATYYTGSPATFCKALRPKYLAQQLLNKMNGGGNVPFQSIHLQTWEQLTITSGKSIRQLDDPDIIISWKDFFQSINSVTNCGFAVINGTAVLEAKSTFYQATIPAATTGKPKYFKIDVYEPYQYSHIKVGYPDPKFSTIVDNNDEVNSTQEYSLPTTRVQRELNLVSIIRADPYGIEDARITPPGSANTNNDNDSFFVKVKVNPEPGPLDYYEPEGSEGYSSMTGVLAGETYYNWDITPHRNLIRHGDFLRSILFGFDTYFINFESALKNAKMSVFPFAPNFSSTEDSDILIGTLPDRLFLPYTINITTDLPKNARQVVDGTPNGYIRTDILGNNYDGFIIDFSADASKNRQREITLLMSPYNLIQNLIR